MSLQAMMEGATMKHLLLDDIPIRPKQIWRNTFLLWTLSNAMLNYSFKIQKLEKYW